MTQKRFTLVINPGTENAMELPNLTRTNLTDRVYELCRDYTISFTVHPYHEIEREKVESLPS